MPSLYAHYRFGALILPRLPADVRGAIARHRCLFDAGLQGPDFFFFYKPASTTDIPPLGRSFHYQTGAEFFTRACRTLHSDSAEEELAYLYGLLGHYCLDSVCHPFVHQHTEEGTIGHNALESEFERYLLALDGVRRPHAYRRSVHMKLPKAHCAMVSRFYPPATAEQIQEAVSGMRRLTDLMTCGTGAHRAIAKAVLQTMGEGKTGLLVPPKPDPACAGLNEPMLELFGKALDRYPELLEQLREHLTFREPLGPEFEPIFG